MGRVIAIVGRPNVGKSMLFNKLTGQRLSIVEDTPGVTRDRLYAESEWRGKSFTLIDTGGIEPGTGDDMLRFMRFQAETAIRHADVVVFVTDIKTGVAAADREVAIMLQRAQKSIVLCVNKVDGIGDPPPELYEFYSLGLGDPYPVSSLHGHGTGDLLDRCFELFPEEPTEDKPDEDVVRVAIIGKPNAGKSSLLNKILGEERAIVSPEAGTTRDALDASFENEYGRFLFIDTAGIRRKSKIDDNIEKYSVLRALMAMDRADVCLILIDAVDGVTEQDTKIAGFAHEKGKACIIAINKWDLIEKDEKTMERTLERVRADLSFMSYAPVIFISAVTGKRLNQVFEQAVRVSSMNAMRIPTGALNEILGDATLRVQPPTDRGRRLKIYYMTQAGVRPPTFVLFCNDGTLFHFSYQRYIENRIREVYGLDGTPIRLVVRSKSDNDTDLNIKSGGNSHV